MSQESIRKELMPLALNLHESGWKSSDRYGDDGFGYEEWYELSKDEADALEKLLLELESQ